MPARAPHAALAAAALLCALAVLPTALSQPAAAPAVQPSDAAAPALAAASAPAPEPAGSLLAADGSLALFPGQSTVRVGLVPGGDYYSNCDEYGGNPANLTGGDPAISRELLRRMGIAEAQISWICITEEDPWDVAIPQALTRGEVDLMPSFKKDESSMKAWPNVTWGPTMDNAYYQTIVRGKPSTSVDSWSLLSAFSPSLWLALFGTALGVGLLAFLVEVSTQNLHGDAASGLALMWDALGRFTQARDMVGFSNAGSIMVLAFSFLCFILSALFTATMASRLTAGQLRTGITSMDQLAGRRVAMRETWLGLALEYGVSFEDAVGHPWNPEIAYSDTWYNVILPGLVAQLRAGTIDALIIGAQDTGYAMGTSCSGELVLLPPFKFYYWSPVMRAGAPSEAAAALNAAGLGMVQDKTFDAITERWYGAPEPPACITTQQQSVSVTFDQVASLWILLAAGACGSLLLVLVHLWRQRWWPTLRERQWACTHLARDGKGGSCCGLPSPPNVLSHAMTAFEAATVPYQPPADELPLTSSGPPPCDGGKGSDGSSLDATEQAAALQAGGDKQAAADEQDSEQRRADEDRREAAHHALPAQLQTGAVGEVARNYARLNSSQDIIISRLLRRLRLRSYT